MRPQTETLVIGYVSAILQMGIGIGFYLINGHIVFIPAIVFGGLIVIILLDLLLLRKDR